MYNYEFNLTNDVLKQIAMVKRSGIQSDYYPQLVEILIELKYNVKQELAINRQRDIKVAEWNDYNNYCEACKQYAKELLGIE